MVMIDVINKLVALAPSSSALGIAIALASFVGFGTALMGMYIDPDRRRKGEKREARKHY